MTRTDLVLAAATWLGAGATVLVVVALAQWLPRRAGSLRATYDAWVRRQCDELHLDVTPREFMFAHLGLSASGLVFGVLTDAVFFGVVLAVFGAVAPATWVARRRAQRMAALDGQLDGAITSIGNTFLVTHNLLQAFEVIATRFDPPISQEARAFCNDVHKGCSMEEALHRLSRRCGSRAMDALVTALVIGRSTGGDLPKILERTATVLRETIRVTGVMNSKTSEGKATILVMALVPFLFLGAMSYLDPAYLSTLVESFAGWVIIAVAATLIIVGLLIARQISTLDI